MSDEVGMQIAEVSFASTSHRTRTTTLTHEGLRIVTRTSPGDTETVKIARVRSNGDVVELAIGAEGRANYLDMEPAAALALGELLIKVGGRARLWARG